MSLLGTLHTMAAAQPTPPVWARILGGSFFGACALGALTLFVFLTYETIAYVTRAVPTISVIVGGWAGENPVWTPVITFLVGIVVAALIVHFSGWRP